MSTKKYNHQLLDIHDFYVIGIHLDWKNEDVLIEGKTIA